MGQDSFGSKAVSETLPISCEDLMERAVPAVQVLVEWSEVWPKMLASASGPHQEAESALKMFARYFLGACKLG